MSLRFVLLLAAGLLLGAEPSREDPVKKELEHFQGSWITTSLTYNGDSFEKYADKLRMVFKGDTATVEGIDEVKKEYPRIVFKLDPSTTPKCVDLTVAGGDQKDAVMEGIYELKGDELRICVCVLGSGRPTKFECSSLATSMAPANW
jgi:uncharacterized protein (TIGR03067 family)